MANLHYDDVDYGGRVASLGANYMVHSSRHRRTRRVGLNGDPGVGGGALVLAL
jgi:hypothetical protein